jgi:hypothetical protein
MDKDLVEGVAIDFLGEGLGEDVRGSLEAGLAAGAVFGEAGSPDELFRAALARSIKSIEAKDRRKLLQRFLAIGPYFEGGPIPPEAVGRYMSDEEVAATIRFIFSSAINEFKGQLAEMLAVKPVVTLAASMGASAGRFGPPRVYVGDAVKARPLRGPAWVKAADFHLLDLDAGAGGDLSVQLRGVVEVKSYAASIRALRPQLDKHVARARRGLLVLGKRVGPERVAVADGPDAPVRVVVVPDAWKLPRAFKLEAKGGSGSLVVEPAEPPMTTDRIDRLGPGGWQITLRWSQEALADVAFAMTFWYMGEMGRLLYEREGVAGERAGMTPQEAGQNAAKMMLYYAILRARTRREDSRAVALYNSYGFGYALGSNFVDCRGRREMLWFSDLEEILEHGRSRTKPDAEGHPPLCCRIRGFEPRGRS